MNVLAIESSGRTLGIALQTGEHDWELTVNRGFSHSESLMSAVVTLTNLAGLTPSQLNLVACSAGPGSFTALRIGMSTAKGIARGASCALKAVPTLSLLALGKENWPGIVVPVMDARKKRVYAAAFRNGERLRDDQDINLEEFFASLPTGMPLLVTGPDAPIAEGLSGVTIDPLHAGGRGLALAREARRLFTQDGADPADLGPLYLRLSEAEEALTNGT